MSISPVSGSPAVLPASPAATGAASTAATTNPYLITGTTTQTNADGTITLVTTYANGSTASTTEPNPYPVTSQGPLNSANTAQQATLLKAQEQSQSQASAQAAASAATALNPAVAQTITPPSSAATLGSLYTTQV